MEIDSHRLSRLRFGGGKNRFRTKSSAASISSSRADASQAFPYKVSVDFPIVGIGANNLCRPERPVVKSERFEGIYQRGSATSSTIERYPVRANEASELMHNPQYLFGCEPQWKQVAVEKRLQNYTDVNVKRNRARRSRTISVRAGVRVLIGAILAIGVVLATPWYVSAGTYADCRPMPVCGEGIPKRSDSQPPAEEEPKKLPVKGEPQEPAEGPVLRCAGPGDLEPLVLDWIRACEIGPAVDIVYMPVSTGRAFDLLLERQADVVFEGASLDPKRLAERGLVQFPSALRAAVLAVNLPGVDAGEVRMTGTVAAKIFLGKIASWNDRELKAHNKEIDLPDLPITVFVRGDPCGLNALLSEFFAKVWGPWIRGTEGHTNHPRWPIGKTVSSTEEMIQGIKAVPGAIGYLSRARLSESGIKPVRLENLEGRFVSPSDTAVRAAAQNGRWFEAQGIDADLTDVPGKASWPITGVFQTVMFEKQADKTKARSVLKFLNCCYGREDLARKHHIEPLPVAVVEKIRKFWNNEITASGASAWP